MKDAEKLERALLIIDRILDPDGEFQIRPGTKGDVLWYELPFLWEKYNSVIHEETR